MKKFLVTGGSRGLGLAVCRRLLEAGHSVTTTSRKPSEELNQVLQENADRFKHCTLDLSELPAVEKFAQDARLLDGIDGFVANAAWGMDGLLTLSRTQDIEHCIRVNLLATMVLAREVVKGMLAQGRGGSLVFVSSVAARSGFSGLSVYAATKGALLAFSRTIAREYGEREIRSNCVLPGYFESDMNAGVDDETREKIRRRTTLGRHVDQADVAGIIYYLLSDASRSVTGAELIVDAGMTA
jgi:3-oxoacyl-[acyl-carrier protein] reductase